MSDASASRETRHANRGKKWALIVGAVVVLTAAAGAAAQFLVRPAQLAGLYSDAGVRRDPLFVSLDQFTVNLADEGGERFAQVGVTLEVADEKVDKAIRAHLPSIRNSVLLLLSSKKTTDLLSLDGKKQLAAEIASQAGRELGWQPVDETKGSDIAGRPARANPIEAVHFSHFIVQ